MDGREYAEAQTRLCNQHKKRGMECVCCPLEDHCRPTSERLINGEIISMIDEEHFRIIEEWSKKDNIGIEVALDYFRKKVGRYKGKPNQSDWAETIKVYKTAIEALERRKDESR